MKKRKNVKKSYKIYLFRHGQTYYNKKGIFTGWKKSSLTTKGIKDAKEVAKKLKNKKFQIAFYTRLPRSMQTLKYVLEYHPECKRLIKDDRMIERSYGILEGTTHKKFIEKIGQRYYNLRLEGDALENLDPKLRKKIEKFFGKQEYNLIHRGYNIAVPNGESFAMVEKRVKSFIKYLKKFIKKNKVNVAISAHGNSIRLFRKIMERAPKDEIIRWFIPYNKIFEYTIKV